MAKIGFCFSGDGARGAIQAGIALSLYRQGIVPDLTIGVSSGSVCAGIYPYLGAEGLADMWRSCKNIFSIFGFNWGFLLKTGVFNQKPMMKRLDEILKNEPICEGIVVDLHLASGELRYTSNMAASKQEYREAFLGSTAISCFVQDRNGWVDAGSRQLAPLQQAIDAGCDEIYIILGAPFEMRERELPRGFCSFAKVGFMAIDTSLCEILRRDLYKCLTKNFSDAHRGVKIHLLEPNEFLYESFLFRKAAEGVEYGLTHYTERREQQIMARYY